MKKINVKPVETLVLEFSDGVTREAKFTTQAMFILSEEFGGFEKVFKNVRKNPFESGAKILYAGMKVCNPDITFKEVGNIVSELPIGAVMEIYNMALESFGDFGTDLKKTMLSSKT